MSRMASASFEIGRRSDTCAATGTPFKAGDDVVTALVERPDGAMERQDFHLQAWDELATKPEGVFAFWRGTASAPGAPRSPLIDSDSILAIFEQLGETDDDRKLAFRYLLALVLVRRRMLTVTESRPARGGRRGAMLVRRRGEGPESEPIEVVDPGMDQSTVADATEQLQAILRADA